jgi:hypothetical protein
MRESVSELVSWLVSQSVRGLLGLSGFELLLLEAGSWSRGIFGNPEEGERSPLEAATKHWLGKTEETLYTCSYREILGI